MPNRKVVLKMVLSFDGFATSPDGTHDWMFPYFGEDGTEWNLRALDAAGTHAMGRRSYEIMGPHWQASEGPVAASMNGKPKAVFSHGLERADWGPVDVFDDVAAGIADLKARDDAGPILVHGGPGLARAVTALGLVDEYQFVRVPIAIGTGLSPFADLTEPVKLELVESRRFASGAFGEILVPA